MVGRESEEGQEKDQYHLGQIAVGREKGDQVGQVSLRIKEM